MASEKEGDDEEAGQAGGGCSTITATVGWGLGAGGRRVSGSLFPNRTAGGWIGFRSRIASLETSRLPSEDFYSFRRSSARHRDPSARYRPAGCPKGPGPIVPVLTAATGPLSASSPYSPSQAGPPTPPAAALLLSAPWRWLVAMVKLAAKCILAGESENLRANTVSGVQRLHKLLRAFVQVNCLPSFPFSLPKAS